LVLKSGYAPKVFGYLLIIAFLGYLTTNSFNLMIPDYDNYKSTLELIFILPMVVGEVGLAVWLLVKCVKISTASIEIEH